MKYRRFGRTELAMPVISCGGMRYQFKWQDVEPGEIPRENQENIEATIHRALELGINHIETARGYGTSEMQLGQVLPKLPRGRIIVQTKVKPYATPQEFIKDFEASTTANCWTGRSGKTAAWRPRGNCRKKAVPGSWDFPHTRPRT
jgi:predicted aldo/keto reductase-like oxidoreductase